MREDEERSHRIIVDGGEGVVISEPMGKDGGGITVGQMGEYAGQGPKKTYRRSEGVSHRGTSERG